MHKTAIERVRVIGSLGLDYLGMPPCSGAGCYGSRHLDLHRTMWRRCDPPPDLDGAPYSPATLHAELLMLQAFGLIEIVRLRMPLSGDYIVDVDFRYTEQGALELLETWTAVHGYSP
jgi:hypothetical protein